MPRTKKPKTFDIDTSRIPVEIWAIILRYAHLTIRDVPSVAIVCKRWNIVSKSNSFWESICLSSIPGYKNIQKKLKNANSIDIAQSVFKAPSSKISNSFCRLCGNPGTWLELCSSILCDSCRGIEKYYYQSASDIKFSFGTDLSTLSDYPIRSTVRERQQYCWGNSYMKTVTVYLVRDVYDAITSKKKGLVARALKKNKLPPECINSKVIQDWLKNEKVQRGASAIVEEYKKVYNKA